MNIPYAIYNPVLDKFLTVDEDALLQKEQFEWSEEDEIREIKIVWDWIIDTANSFTILFGEDIAREMMNCVLVPLELDGNHGIVKYMHDQNIAIKDWI